ncbi:MAG: Fic family protein [Bacteroidales bacterium]|jgi:Fic family protein|nr:Fic family protein [Bacteroidales bacterium]
MNNFFTNSPLWYEQIGKIYALFERVKISEEQSKDLLRLRRTSRILSISSTTAIEGNRLTTQQVFDVINGKTVFAPQSDIKEVKNAFTAYEQMPNLNPYSVDDFLKAHSLITENLVEEAGKFRTVGVAVVNSNREIIHSGANHKEVPTLIEELFEWGKTADTHPLIKSSAIHFMIEHIHPFRDGNGRIGRLWQTLVLSKWNSIFEWLPVETMVYHNQAKYYEALQKSHDKKGTVDCFPFINFMLDVIENSVYKYVDVAVETNAIVDDPINTPSDPINLNLSDNEAHHDPINLPLDPINDPINSFDVLDLIKNDPYINYETLVEKTGRSRATIKRMVKRLKQEGFISRIGSNKTGYWQVR